MVRKLMVVVAVCVVLGTACGGDDDTPGTVSVEGKPYVDAMTDSLRVHGAGDLALTPAEARCIAPKWVNILRPERLDEAGVAPQDLASADGLDEKAPEVALTDGEISKLVDAFGECELDLQRAFVGSLTAGAALGPDDEACLVEAIPDDLTRRSVAMAVTDGVDAVDDDAGLMSELFQALSACPGAIDLGG